ncbi:MAG: hypothetical protein MPEBLZ_04439 [Candidatus Methanoperedens nitroreducens]|uniref:Glycosyltransferase RgtA/B/C/D-like domain-containing protein n=1 Tax=Candidatus Methanoperedens nitratireducens TaxID=1392998 RepID=A0A0P8CEZ0_9EURY|nr:MAG: hypothetical protein MPEBLZ_04439 [Candidatus Methanoperedens sp. BLZ1]
MVRLVLPSAGGVQNILESKYIDTNSANLLSYNSWPATHLISAFIISIGNVSLGSLIKYMPLFWIIALIYFTYAAGKIFNFSPNQSFLLSFIILTSFILFLYYYGPPSIAYLFFVMIFICLNDICINRKNRLYIPLILLISALVVTHLLTSLVVIVVIFIMYLIERRLRTLMLFFDNSLLFMVLFFCTTHNQTYNRQFF